MTQKGSNPTYPEVLLALDGTNINYDDIDDQYIAPSKIQQRKIYTKFDKMFEYLKMKKKSSKYLDEKIEQLNAQLKEAETFDNQDGGGALINCNPSEKHKHKELLCNYIGNCLGYRFTKKPNNLEDLSRLT